MGITVFVARTIDLDFRASLGDFWRRKLPIQKLLPTPINEVSINLLDPHIEEQAYFGVFQSLQVKVNSKQFILDSLIALSFKFASHNGPYNQQNSENFYSISRSMLAKDGLKDLFNSCKG